MKPSHRIVIGTHHKTGTVLMASIFRKLSNQLGMSFHNCLRDPSLPPDWQVAFDPHSRFEGIALGDHLRGVHLIRDPRMVVVSAALYHRRSTEKWLHVPRPAFGGQTYQQAIDALPTDRDRFLFEMDHKSGQVIREMLGWVDRALPWCIDVKLESLMAEEGLDTYFRMFRHLGFSGAELLRALSVAYGQSVFNAEARRTEHVRSARVEHWSEYYDADLLAAFTSRFGDACARLGYR